MKKPEAWTAYDQGDPVYVYDVSEADEYSNALEAALAEAVELLRELFDPSSTDRGSGYAQRVKALLAELEEQ